MLMPRNFAGYDLFLCVCFQEAFNLYKQDLVSKSRERQKLVCLAAEERKVQEYLRHERENIFADNRKLPVNLYAHPLSGKKYITLFELKEPF